MDTQGLSCEDVGTMPRELGRSQWPTLMCPRPGGAWLGAGLGVGTWIWADAGNTIIQTLHGDSETPGT